MFITYLQYLEGESFPFISVPAHIGYLALAAYKIRPSVSIGLLSPSYAGGLALNINKRINIGIQSWANFSSKNAPWVPEKLFAYSILGSIYIEL